jgi:hypothetical protein
MKKQLFALLSLGVIMAASSAFAQTVKADIPFSYIVSGGTLPAGEYTIQKLALSSQTLVIRSSDGQTQRMVQPNRCEAMNAPGQSKLVFHKYGDEYFLAEIWVAGNNSGHQFPKSRRETQVARDYTAPKTVVIAALE